MSFILKLVSVRDGSRLKVVKVPGMAEIPTNILDLYQYTSTFRILNRTYFRGWKK